MRAGLVRDIIRRHEPARPQPPDPRRPGQPDTRRLAIDRVGIKSIRHPVKIRERAGGIQHTVAHFNMYVGLPHHFKGTHMSRFVEILNAHEREISPDTFRVMLREMVKKLEAESGHIEMTFPYFVNKKAPVSGVAEPDGLRGHLRGRDPRRPRDLHAQGAGAGDEPVPVLEEDLRARRAQPALARDRRRAHQHLRLDRGDHRPRREPGLERALGAAQAPRREVRDRARLRQPQVRRGHGARHRRGAERATRASRATWWRARTSSPSTTTRPTR